MIVIIHQYVKEIQIYRLFRYCFIFTIIHLFIISVKQRNAINLNLASVIHVDDTQLGQVQSNGVQRNMVRMLFNQKQLVCLSL